MFTYHIEKNRYGDEHIAVFANGSQIAEIKPSSYYGKNEYIVSATIGDGDRGDCLGRTSTIAGAKKKVRAWYSDHSDAVAAAAANSRAAAEVRAKIASDRAKYKAESHPAGDTLSTCFNWGDGCPMVNALYLLDVLEALPGCTAACRPSELSSVYFHSPDGDALIMPIRKYTAHNTDEQEEQE